MLKTVKDACTIHPSTLDYQISSGVESLFQTINTGDRGQEFFKKNYLTRGMEELLREGLLRLSGRSEQALFVLMQAMGGGKTHLMSCLGLLAKFPERRAEILPQDLLDRLDNNQARVAIFDGRESPDNYLWGRLAEQLDASEIIRPYWQNGPKPPDKTAWKKAIGDAPPL